MKRIFITLALAGLFTSVFCQTYNMGSAPFVSTCSGVFYDNGGAAGNYTDNQNDTITFCSAGGGFITVNFTFSDLVAGDHLYVYYGDVASGTPNTTNPTTGLIVSTCPCITLVFISDAAGNKSGWAATIGCTTPSTIANDDIVYSTEPTLDGTLLSGQTNLGADADIFSGCFDAGNTVWYGFSLSGGNNTISTTISDASFTDVQLLLLHSYNCSDGSAVIIGSECTTTGNTVTWTNLTAAYYWLGIASPDAGAFSISFTESYQDFCGDYFCGPSESCLTCPFDCGLCPEAEGGPYYHPITGMQNTKLGQCLVSTNVGNYYDNGGPGMTYASDINNIFRTFCPSSPHYTIEATVENMSLEYAGVNCKDQLLITNGPSPGSALLWSGCGNSSTSAIRTTDGVYNGGVFKSTHSSGCLTFSLITDASNAGFWDGWTITLKEVTYASGPELNYNNDCERAIPLCDDFTVSSQTYGPGFSSESCASCILTESFSEWYKVKVSHGGTMEFEITPLGNSDMDFAIYRADSCGALTTPVRCSHALYQPPGKTGLSKASGDMSEDIGGDQWVSELAIETGSTYYILINECNKMNPNAYTLDFKLSGGASFDCSIVLPVEFLDFNASVKTSAIELTWKTASETNNDYFTIERSIDGIHFFPLAFADGNGNSNEIVRYFYTDENPYQGLAYYRIKQTDFDGKSDYSQVLPIDFMDQKLPWLNVYPSPATDFIHVSTDETSINQPYNICNALGAIVETGICQKTEFNISIADFEEGAYYFSINNQQQMYFIVSQ